MKKLLFAILLGAALCCGVDSCDKDKDPKKNEKPYFRFDPVANPGDRLVRIDEDNHAYIIAAESFVGASTLFSYDDAGYLTGHELAGSKRVAYEYGDLSFRETVYSYLSLTSSWPLWRIKSYKYEDGVISLEKKEGDIISTKTIVLNEDGSVKSYGNLAVEWNNGNITSLEYPGNYHASIEYSSMENPWCGVDIFAFIFAEGEDATLMPGLFHTKNIPSRITAKEPDRPATVFILKTDFDVSSRPVRITLMNEDESVYDTYDLFYGTHDAETVRTLTL